MSEYEDQQEANRIIAAHGGLGTAPQDKRLKYDSFQPPVTRIQARTLAENLVIKGHTLLRVERSAQGGWSFVFAGKEPAETAKLIATGKLTFDDSPRIQAARKYAQEVIGAAVLEHNRQENLSS
jgi:hypothetical protein